MNVALITIEAVVTIQKLFPGVFYNKKMFQKVSKYTEKHLGRSLFQLKLEYFRYNM